MREVRGVRVQHMVHGGASIRDAGELIGACRGATQKVSPLAGLRLIQGYSSYPALRYQGIELSRSFELIIKNLNTNQVLKVIRMIQFIRLNFGKTLILQNKDS